MNDAAAPHVDPSWSMASGKFEWDGSLRDIIIRDCVPADWKHLFETIGGTSGVRLALPSGEPDFWAEPALALARHRGQAIWLTAGGIRLKCDIVSPELIEFDLDPRDVKDAARFHALVALMQAMASTLSRPVMMTEEGDHTSVLLEVQPFADGAVRALAFS